MDAKTSRDLTNSKQIHNRQTFWQIYIPIIVALGLLILAAYFIFQPDQTASTDTRFWADISAMLITLPLTMMILLAIIFVGLCSLIFAKALAPVKNAFFKLSQIVGKFQKAGHKSCSAIQEIFIETESALSIFSKK